MNPNKILSIISVAATALLCNCAPSYVPNAVNVPMFTNKNEVQVSIYTGTSGFDPQLGFALTDHIGLICNGSFRNYTSDNTDEFHKHKFVELGAGYYERFRRNGSFEAFGGYGRGMVNAFIENGSIFNSSSDVISNRFFLQTSFGHSTEITDSNYALRFVAVNYPQEDIYTTRLYLEPVLTFKLGFKYIKSSVQFGYSIPCTANSFDHMGEYQPFMFSFGLHGYINKLFD